METLDKELKGSTVVSGIQPWNVYPMKTAKTPDTKKSLCTVNAHNKRQAMSEGRRQSHTNQIAYAIPVKFDKDQTKTST